MTKLGLTSIGNSAGLVLPKEVLARLKLDKGDVVYLTEAPDGASTGNKGPEVHSEPYWGYAPATLAAFTAG